MKKTAVDGYIPSRGPSRAAVSDPRRCRETIPVTRRGRFATENPEHEVDDLQLRQALTARGFSPRRPAPGSLTEGGLCMRIWRRTALLTAALALAARGGGGEEASQTPPTPAQTPPSTAAGEDAEQVSVFLDADVIEGKAPLTVHFRVELTGGMPPFKWSWSYGDGKTGDAADTKHAHTYEKPGTYLAQLEVQDARGHSDFDILDIEVSKE
jgi:hypothetical protein